MRLQEILEKTKPFTVSEAHDLAEKCLNFTEILCATEFYPYQEEMARAICIDVLSNIGGTYTGLFSRQSGKDLDINTPILTSGGWSTMGEIDVGDYVCDANGNFTKVVATSPTFTDHDCYKLRFSDGSEIVAGKDHLWTIQENREWKTKRTEELFKNPYISNTRGYKESRYRVRGDAVVTGGHKNLPIDPYVLGYWIGDGHTNDGVITVGGADRVPLEQELVKAKYDIQSYDKAAWPTVGIRVKGLRGSLGKLGCLGNKHIPDLYTRGSIEQRRALLAGLLDSDGYLSKTSVVEFSTTLSSLATQVHQLARSLGEKPTIIVTQGQYSGKKCKLVHRVCWKPQVNPFRLERKRSRWIAPKSSRQKWIQLRDIQKVPTRPTRCLQVAHESHTFLVGKTFIPTHNSECVANTGAALMVLLPVLANLPDPEAESSFMYPQLVKFRRGLKVGIFSPSTQQSSTTYKRLRDKLTSTDGQEILKTPDFAPAGIESLWPPVANTTTYLELSNGSSALMMSADKQSNIESKTFHMILLDEAQDLDEFVVGKSIMPMGASTNATSVATGTPGTTKGFFYNMIAENKLDQMDRRRAYKDFVPQLHFEYDYKVVQRYNPDYKKYIKKEKKRLGEESDEFKMAYRLIWLLERGMAVTQEQFDKLTKKHLNIVTSLEGPELVAGLDWGKESDSTVLTVGRPLWEDVDEQGKAPVEVLNWWERLGDNWEEIMAASKEEIAKYSIRTLAVDATGVGEPLYERMAWDLPHITVLPVKFSAQAKDHLYKFFLLMIQEEKVWWPGDSRVRKRKYFKMFEQQMTNLVKEYKNQYMACHAPEDQRNAHDDFPDSLALMLWCINENAMPFIQQGDNSDMYQGHNWHKPGGGFSLR